VREIEENTSDR